VQVLTSRPLLQSVFHRLEETGSVPDLGPDPIGELQQMLAQEFGARAAPAAFDADFAQLYKVVNGIGHMLIRRRVG